MDLSIYVEKVTLSLKCGMSTNLPINFFFNVYIIYNIIFQCKKKSF